MSDLDLDALEQRIRERWLGFREDADIIFALIQRLREAERRLVIAEDRRFQHHERELHFRRFMRTVDLEAALNALEAPETT